MRSLLEQMTARLRGFLDQRDSLFLVVRAGEAEAVGTLKILENLEESSKAELFWVFPEKFASAAAYTQAAVKSFGAKHEAVRLLQRREGMATWPPLPGAVEDAARPPVERMQGLMTFARSLLPEPEGCLVVWALFPLEIADKPGYARFVQDLSRHEFPFPWCHHLRTILRDDPAEPVLERTLGKPPRVEWYAADLSPAALERAMEAEVTDPARPMPERMQALLLTAGIDYAHKRYRVALDKYRLLYKYYAGTKNGALTALVLNGMGEAHRESRNAGEAAGCFQAALTAASLEDPPPVPVLLNATLNLADLRMAEKNWAEAEGYYDAAQQLATAMHNPDVKLRSLENLGLARYQQGKHAEAVEAWQAAATVAEKLKRPDLGKPIVARLKQHYTSAGDHRRQRELDEQLARMG